MHREKLFFALFLALAFLLRAPWYGDPAPDFDEQIYHLIGRSMLEGAVPYVDLWDRKPIGLFAIYALGALISGGSVWGYMILATIFAAVGAYLTFKIGLLYSTKFAASVGGLIYVLIFPLYYGAVGQSEVFYLPLLLAMLISVLKAQGASDDRTFIKQAVIAMLLGGISLQIKYTTVLACLACGGWLLYFVHVRFGSIKRVLTAGLGFAALGLFPTIMVAIIYGIAGHLQEFLFANFFSIFERNRPGGAIVDSWSDVILVKALPTSIAAVAWLGLAAMRGKFDTRLQIVATFSIACLASHFMLGSSYFYYFIPAAAGINLLAIGLFAEGVLGKLVAAVAILHAGFFARPLESFGTAQVHREGIERASAILRPHVSQSRCLWVYDGPTALYSAIDTCIPTKFAYSDHLNNVLEKDALGIPQAQAVQEVLNRRPGAIVTAPKLFQVEENPEIKKIVESYLADNCELLEVIYFRHRDLSAYACR